MCRRGLEEEEEEEGDEGWADAEGVCACVCGLLVGRRGEGVAGISTEPQSRWCRCEWVFSVSARPGLSSSRAHVQGFISVSLSIEDPAAH